MFDAQYIQYRSVGVTGAILAHEDDLAYDFYLLPDGDDFKVCAYGKSFSGREEEVVKVIDADELDQLIAELQRMRAGCFEGEWPRPLPPKPDPELERLLREEEEIERRTRAHDEQQRIDASRVTQTIVTNNYGTKTQTIQGRPTVGALKAFLDNYEDGQELAIDVRVAG